MYDEKPLVITVKQKILYPRKRKCAVLFNVNLLCKTNIFNTSNATSAHHFPMPNHMKTNLTKGFAFTGL